jgi:hypothetical protein
MQGRRARGRPSRIYRHLAPARHVVFGDRRVENQRPSHKFPAPGEPLPPDCPRCTDRRWAEPDFLRYPTSGSSASFSPIQEILPPQSNSTRSGCRGVPKKGGGLMTADDTKGDKVGHRAGLHREGPYKRIRERAPAVRACEAIDRHGGGTWLR